MLQISLSWRSSGRCLGIRCSNCIECPWLSGYLQTLWTNLIFGELSEYSLAAQTHLVIHFSSILHRPRFDAICFKSQALPLIFGCWMGRSTSRPGLQPPSWRDYWTSKHQGCKSLGFEPPKSAWCFVPPFSLCPSLESFWVAYCCSEMKGASYLAQYFELQFCLFL